MGAQFLDGFFQGETVFVVASGPSLKGFDFGLLNGERVIAVNKAAQFVKPSLAVYVDKSMEGFMLGQNLDCPVITANYGGCPKQFYSVWVDARTDGQIRGPAQNDFNHLYGFGSSTAVAISAALVGGAAQVYVLGLDLEGGYFYTGSESPALRDMRNQEIFFRRFAEWSLTERVINLNPDSRVEVFKKQSLEVI